MDFTGVDPYDNLQISLRWRTTAAKDDTPYDDCLAINRHSDGGTIVSFQTSLNQLYLAMHVARYGRPVLSRWVDKHVHVLRQ